MMRGIGWLAVMVCIWGGSVQAADGSAEVVRRGQRLYMNGMRADGAALRAQRAGVPDMVGAAAACVQCHRRSGRGDQEGRVRVPSIVAADLFAPGRRRSFGRTAPGIEPPSSPAEQRPSYDADSLRQALTKGVAAGGRPLSPWMPRYALDDRDFADLLAYLRQLDPADAPPPRGLMGNTLHVATIVTPDAPAPRREAVRSVLTAWAKAQHFGPVGVELHVWDLEGPPTQWAGQLNRFLARQPVYAVLAGAGREQWQPVDQFCEAQALPCLFPLIDAAPATSHRYYTVHFSEGPRAESRMAARAVAQMKQVPKAVQVWFDSDLGREAADILRRELETRTVGVPRRPVTLVDARLGPGTTEGHRAPLDGLVVSWLGTDRLQTLLGAWAAHEERPRHLWLSGELTPPEALTLDAVWRERVRWMTLRSDTVRFNATAAMGLQPWLQSIGLPTSMASAATGDVYAATFFFTDALQRTRGAWRADHLIERLESAVNNRPPAGAYLRLSLGPGQRVAAQVGQLQGYVAPDFRLLAPISPVLNAND